MFVGDVEGLKSSGHWLVSTIGIITKFSDSLSNDSGNVSETKEKMLNKDIACRDGQVDDEVAIITYGALPGTHPI